MCDVRLTSNLWQKNSRSRSNDTIQLRYWRFLRRDTYTATKSEDIFAFAASILTIVFFLFILSLTSPSTLQKCQRISVLISSSFYLAFRHLIGDRKHDGWKHGERVSVRWHETKARIKPGKLQAHRKHLQLDLKEFFSFFIHFL